MFYLYFMIIVASLLISMQICLRWSRRYRDLRLVRMQAIYPLMQSKAIRPVEQYKDRF